MLKLYGRESDHGIRIGDLARFPLNLAEPDNLYPPKWIVTHFTLDRAKEAFVAVRRLADGQVKVVGERFFNQYRVGLQHVPRTNLWKKVKDFRSKKLASGGCDCCVPHREEFNFYVTVYDAGKVQVLLGPYEHHGHAIQDVPLAKKIANEVDFRSHFYSFGTTSFQKSFTKPGILENLREKYS